MKFCLFHLSRELDRRWWESSKHSQIQASTNNTDPVLILLADFSDSHSYMTSSRIGIITKMNFNVPESNNETIWDPKTLKAKNAQRHLPRFNPSFVPSYCYSVMAGMERTFHCVKQHCLLNVGRTELIWYNSVLNKMLKLICVTVN